MSRETKDQPKILSSIANDLPAGLVVFLVALPLCLGISLASGTAPISGLIAGIVGGIVIGALSGSSVGVSGPAAGLTSIIIASLDDLNGKYEYFLIAVVLSGVFQVIFGVIKAGVIGDYFPSSVIKGMLAAIGIILIMKQIPHAFGYDKDAMGDMSFFQSLDGENTFSELYHLLDHGIEKGALTIAIISIGILLLLQQNKLKKLKLFKILPASLLVVMAGIGINELFITHLPSFALIEKEHLVNLPVIDSWEALGATLKTPDLSYFTIPGTTSDEFLLILQIAGTIALVGSLETLLSVEASDKLDHYKRITPPNRELWSQGVGNIISGLIGGIPITQVIVRSSANVNSGGKTKISAVFHGVLLLLSVLIFPHILNKIPLSC